MMISLFFNFYFAVNGIGKPETSPFGSYKVMD